MGTDCSTPRFICIGFNVKVYHRAEKGWTNIVSTVMTSREIFIVHYNLVLKIIIHEFDD